MPGPDAFANGLYGRPIEADGRVVYALSGEINNCNCVTVADRVLRMWSRQIDATTLELDMAAVSLIDSTGLRALTVLSQELASAGGHLRIVRPSLPVRRVLQLTGLDRLLGLITQPA